MAFVKKTWKDRIVQYANRRLLTKSGGEVEQVTVTRDEGTISEAGDQFNASNMNDLEKRIKDGFDADTSALANKLDKSAIKVVSGTGTTNANGVVTPTDLGIPILSYNSHIILSAVSSNDGVVVNVGQYNQNFYFVCTNASNLATPIANTSVTITVVYMDK